VAAVKTSDIGLALIKSRWSEAIELLLMPRPNEEKRVARGRAFWWMYRGTEVYFFILEEVLSCHLN
jgi:tRNA(Glu) U13 pseudouridine synthase TruD